MLVEREGNRYHNQLRDRTMSRSPSQSTSFLYLRKLRYEAEQAALMRIRFFREVESLSLASSLILLKQLILECLCLIIWFDFLITYSIDTALRTEILFLAMTGSVLFQLSSL